MATRGIPGIAANVGPVERGLSVASGGALLLAALRSDSAARLPLALSGAYLLARGATGHCMLYSAINVDAAHEGPAAVVPLRATITIDRPVEEVYRFWRAFTNLPRFVHYLESVEEEGTESVWRARGPAGVPVEWRAELVEDRENEVIGWRSLPGSVISHSGGVRFHRAPGNRGTEVHLRVMVTPGSGPMAAAARFATPITEQAVRSDLRRLKQILETGEVATTEGQSSARAGAATAERARAAADRPAPVQAPVRPLSKGAADWPEVRS